MSVLLARPVATPCEGLGVSLPLLRGSRLLLRPASMGDLDFFARLNSDIDVMAHVSGRPARRSETQGEWDRRLGPRSDVENGLGYWVGWVEKQPIGWWGLGRTESATPAGELGFRLCSTHWRRGFGAEGARILLGHGFGDRALARIWAGTTVANTASRKTLESVGLRQTEEPFPGVLTYEITYTEWLDQDGPPV